MKKGKPYNFSWYVLATFILRETHKENLLLDGDNEVQSQLVNYLKDTGTGKIPVEKRSFLKNSDYFSV